MTSSLVGSEMCIRDRLLDNTFLIYICLSSNVAPSRAFPSAGGWSSLFPPVSYTHLTLPTICSV
eukprot:6700144-Prorocentrum_lima.AAC.1